MDWWSDPDNIEEALDNQFISSSVVEVVIKDLGEVDDA